MDRSRLALLALAVILLVAGAALSRCSETAEEAPEGGERALLKQPPKPKVVYPRDAFRRARKPSERKEQAAKLAKAAADPIQRAMATPGGGTVFVEVNAIRHSKLASALLRCREAEATESLRAMKEMLGIDPLEEVDRVAIHEDLIAVSGFFEELKMPDGVETAGEYGDGASMFKLPNPESADGAPMHLAKLGDGLLVLGETEADVRAAVDRAEGRGEPAQPMAPHLVRGSEIYGRFGPELLAELLGNAAGADPLVQTVQQVVTGMALMRQQAKNDGVDELAALLAEARVLPQKDGAFGVDVAVPGDLILDALDCPRD
jgi:hypothetical protein